MWLKLLSICSQISVLVLAAVLVAELIGKQANTASLGALRSELFEELKKDRDNYNDRFLRLKDELVTYQNTREKRATVFGERLEVLETYLRIKPANVKAPIEDDKNKQVDYSSVIDNNLQYLEDKINRSQNESMLSVQQVESRILVLESRVKAIEEENTKFRREAKVINNNANNFTVVTERKNL